MDARDLTVLRENGKVCDRRGQNWTSSKARGDAKPAGHGSGPLHGRTCAIVATTTLPRPRGLLYQHDLKLDRGAPPRVAWGKENRRRLS